MGSITPAAGTVVSGAASVTGAASAGAGAGATAAAAASSIGEGAGAGVSIGAVSVTSDEIASTGARISG